MKPAARYDPAAEQGAPPAGQGDVNVVFIWLSNIPVSRFGEQIEQMISFACRMRLYQSAQFVPKIR